MTALSTKWYHKNKAKVDARAKITAPQWRANNPEKAKAIRQRAEEKLRKDPERLKADKERRRQYRKTNPKLKLLNDAKYRARKQGLDFTLTLENLPSDEGYCPILGTPFERGGAARRAGVSPTLDRIDNLKGYTPDNVWFISHRANLLKGSGTADEHEAIAKAMRAKLNALPKGA